MANGAAPERDDRSELLAAIERMERDPLWREPRGDEYRRRQDAIAEMMEET